MRLRATIVDAFRLLDRPLRWASCLSLLASLVLVIIETFSIFLVYPLILAMVGGGAAINFPPLSRVIALLPDQNRVTTVSTLILGLMTVKSVLGVALTWWQQGFVHRGAATTACRLLDAYMAAPLVMQQARNSAELQRNVNVSIRIVFSNIILATLSIASEMIVLCLMLLILFLVNAEAILVATTAFAASLMIYHRFLAALPAAAGRRLETENMQVFKHLNQALGAARELRITGRESRVSAIFRRHKMAQAHALRVIGTLSVVPRIYLELTVTLMLLGAVLWMSGSTDGTTAVAMLGLFGAATLRMLPSVHRILAQLQSIEVGAASLANVKNDLRGLHTLEARTGPEGPVDVRREIELRGLRFFYPNSARPAIDGVDLKIARGACIGIVGASGAGKSTLIDILLGLLTPADGRVKVDDEDITGRPARWRGVVGYVPQSIFLLDDTLKRNIALGLGDEEIDLGELTRVIEIAQIAELVALLPAGVDTVIGEHGVRLSGGQRQRIGIARALYGNPSLLVMDEGTSALDSETESRVAKALELLRGEKTIILIAHRLSTVQHCDSIVFMQDGKVVDQGRFDELTRRHADFAKLVEFGDLGQNKRAAYIA